MPIACRTCGGNAQVKRPKTGDPLCKECFYYAFEEEIHHTVVAGKLFIPGETVAIGASGGKDSTVLAHVMKVLNERHNYGLNLVLLSIDEGITGYRDDSLETVKINQKEYDLPLKIVSYQDLYGWTMDAIVKQIGMKNNCTYCGVFRRQALDRGAMLLKVDKIVTGHNADDIAETVIMNVLRGDIARLRRCTAITTGTDGSLPRCKPFKYTYEKDIVMYAFHKHLTYFSTECIYSPNAYRGFARAYIKDLERIQPSTIIDIIHSGESLSVKKDVRMPVQTTCTRCGYISSNELCKACVMLEGLNRGRPRLGIGKAHKERRLFEEELARQKTEGGEGVPAEANTSTPSPTPTRCCGRGACSNKRSRSTGIEGSAGIHSGIEDEIGNSSGDTQDGSGTHPDSGLGSGDADVLAASAYSPDSLSNSLPLSDSRISSCIGGGCGRGYTDCTKGNLADCSAVDSVDIRVINGGDISAGGGGDAGSNPEKIGGDGDVEEVVNGVKKLRVFGQPAHSKPNVLDF